MNLIQLEARSLSLSLSSLVLFLFLLMLLLLLTLRGKRRRTLSIISTAIKKSEDVAYNTAAAAAATSHASYHTTTSQLFTINHTIQHQQRDRTYKPNKKSNHIQSSIRFSRLLLVAVIFFILFFSFQVYLYLSYICKCHSVLCLLKHIYISYTFIIYR